LQVQLLMLAEPGSEFMFNGQLKAIPNMQYLDDGHT
jgi:hypothetical protein